MHQSSLGPLRIDDMTDSRLASESVSQARRGNSLIEHAMRAFVLQLCSDFCAQDLDLFGLPLEHRGEEPHREGLETVYRLDEIEKADIFLHGGQHTHRHEV